MCPLVCHKLLIFMQYGRSVAKDSFRSRLKSSKQNLLHATHIAHAIIVHRSISSFDSLSNMPRVKRKKICCMGIAFPNLTTDQSPQIISRGAFAKSMAYIFSMLVAHHTERLYLQLFSVQVVVGWQDIRTSPPQEIPYLQRSIERPHRFPDPSIHASHKMVPTWRDEQSLHHTIRCFDRKSLGLVLLLDEYIIAMQVI